MENSYITVIGGANIDIGGSPFNPLIQKDSNPGRVSTSLGGVGRNIAHNLALLGNNVRFISALGDDANGATVRKSCMALGIDIEDSMLCSDQATSTYLFIADSDGDMALAVSDMEIYYKLTPEFFESKLNIINGSSLVIIDANIPEESIQYLCKNVTVPIFAETVSCTKSLRFASSLDKIHTITPNGLEAEILTGIKVDPNDDSTLEAVADAFLEKGLKQVIITLGDKGCFVADNTTKAHLPCFPTKMINATGAGDSLLAGIATAFAKDYSLTETAYIGMACASMTIEDSHTINESITYGQVLTRAGL